MTADKDFKSGDFVVYPTHGVGQIKGVETQEIAGQELQLFVVEFAKEKMTLRVPVTKAKTSCEPQGHGQRPEDPQGPLARQADHVEPPRAGIRS